MKSDLLSLFLQPCPPGESSPFAGSWLVTSLLGQGLRVLSTRGVAAEPVPDVLVCSQMCWCAERDAQKHRRNPEEPGEAQGRVNPMSATTAITWVDVHPKSKWNPKIFQNKNVVFPIFHQNHRIIETLRLEKTSNITKSNHLPITTY